MNGKPKTDEQLLAEAQALDDAYARADAFDAAHAPEHQDDDNEHVDEMAELRKAALNRGQP